MIKQYHARRWYLTNDIMSNTAVSLLLQVTSCPVQLPHQITTAAAALLCSLVKLDTLLQLHVIYNKTQMKPLKDGLFLTSQHTRVTIENYFLLLKLLGNVQQPGNVQ